MGGWMVLLALFQLVSPSCFTHLSFISSLEGRASLHCNAFHRREKNVQMAGDRQIEMDQQPTRVWDSVR